MSRLSLSVSAGHDVQAAHGVAGQAILREDAIAFVNRLVRRFAADIGNLLADRDSRQERFDKGELPRFLPETRVIRESDWQIAPIPRELLDPRAGITGPPDRQRMIEAIDSGVRAFTADFEDSLSPTWANVVDGHWNLYEAVHRSVVPGAEGGEQCRLIDRAVLIVRPRGWHLGECHWTVDGRPAPAALVDFGLYLFHNHAELRERGAAPCFCLPKVESHHEARLWAEVIAYAEAALALAPGTIRVTVVIETLPAVFEMDEILWELKRSILGLDCGYSNYVFSIIKTLHEQPAFALPERQHLTMTTPFMTAYSQLLTRTCHRRGALETGGRARQLPDDTPNEADLLRFPAVAISEAALRSSISVSLQYLTGWLAGSGCVAIHNRMEDVATAEICRAQISQWMRHQKRLGDGRPVTFDLVRGMIREEQLALRRQPAAANDDPDYLARAVGVLTELLGTLPFPAFLTLRAYDELTLLEKERGVL